MNENFMGLFPFNFEVVTLVYRQMELHQKLGGCEACHSFGAHKKGKIEHEEDEGGVRLNIWWR